MHEHTVAPDIAELLSGLARDLQTHRADMAATLDAIASAAVEMVPAAERCSITRILARNRVVTEAATDDIARALDAQQEKLGDGPCMESEWGESPILIHDMQTDERWPHFATRAIELGVGSMLCLRLYADQDELGALNLHANDTHAFQPADVEVGLLFAAHAALAVAGAEREEQFKVALASRDVIGQAKGILMARYSLSETAAFAALVRLSQQANTKLLEVAQHVIETGAVEGTP